MLTNNLHEDYFKESTRELRQIALSSYNQVLKAKEEGIKLGEERIIRSMYNHNISMSKISEIVGMSVQAVESIISK